jgi:hypothetical protein
MEVVVSICAGSLCGVAVAGYDGTLYQGLLIRPFTLLSPSPIEAVLPILGLIISSAVGLSAAPAAVKIFSEERQIYFREASAGSSPLAYFLGKNLASMYRLVISSWHFTAFYHFLACPAISFNRMYLIHLGMYFCIYGVAFAVGMLVKRENASLAAGSAMIVMAVMSGGAPSLTDMRRIKMGWLLDACFTRWATEAWYSEEVTVFDGVFEIYDVSAKIFGFTLWRYWFDITMLLIHGLVWRVIAFLLLIGLNRSKQK